MEWESIFVGFAMGLIATLIGVRLQRSWQELDDKRFQQKVLESLVVEIQNGLERTKGLIKLRDQKKISFGRIYVALCDSVSQRLAGNIKDAEVINLLHQIYHRFDLINFNFDKDRPGASSAFAETYADEIERNLKLFKQRIGMKNLGTQPSACTLTGYIARLKKYLVNCNLQEFKHFIGFRRRQVKRPLGISIIL